MLLSLLFFKHVYAITNINTFDVRRDCIIISRFMGRSDSYPQKKDIKKFLSLEQLFTQLFIQYNLTLAFELMEFLFHTEHQTFGFVPVLGIINCSIKHYTLSKVLTESVF